MMDGLFGGMVILAVLVIFAGRMVKAFIKHDILGENDGRWNRV